MSYITLIKWQCNRMVFCCIVAWIQPDISGFSCCLKMKSVENIFGHIGEQPLENLWNCLGKYTKMFKTDSFLDNKKLNLTLNFWRDHEPMPLCNRILCCTFGWYFNFKNEMLYVTKFYSFQLIQIDLQSNCFKLVSDMHIYIISKLL